MGIASLETGKRALLANQRALDATSGNISNVNTPGYSRRTPVLSETDPYGSPSGFVGTGVIAAKLRTYREEFFDRDIRSTKSRLSAHTTDADVLKRIEAILGEPSNEGLGDAVGKFFDAFENLSLQPENLTLRENLLIESKNLTDKFHIAANKINELKNDISKKTHKEIDEANSLIKEIADLNLEIKKSYSIDKTAAQTYIDKREYKLERLAELIDVKITEGGYGTINVFASGANLVSGAFASKLSLKEAINSATGEKTLKLYREFDGSKTQIKAEGGSIGAALERYNETLNAEASSGFSIARELNRFADAIAREVNSRTTRAYGLKDKTAPAPGRRFFDSRTGKITAATIEVSKDVAGKPADIPLSSAPNSPGNADAARAISKIAEDKAFLDGRTPSEFFYDLTTRLGELSKSAQNGKETSSVVLEQLENQRSSIIGVNLDEEAINLIKFQKSFEAASRIVATVNSALQTIVNLGR